MYGSKTIAITLNTAKMKASDAREYATKLEEELNIPVILPLEDGVDSLLPLLTKMIRGKTK
jgi:uncharacterized NAD-dependent epimerase/dehydratase family protein